MSRVFLIAAYAVLLTLAAHPLPAQNQNVPSAPENATPPAPPPPPVAPSALNLDHVVAVIGTNVILQSDVEQEMRFSALEPLRVLPGENSPDRALRRLIDRTLILEQMKEQQQAVTAAAPEVEASLRDLRKQIPACDEFHCESDQGWHNFLKAHGLTEAEVQKRWTQRLAILDFIDLRFRSGINVTSQEVTDYYSKVLLPALEKSHDKAPPLQDVKSRIEEIVLQQHVSGLFQDWLSSLRDEGNVQVVDSAYSSELHSPGSDSGGEDQSQ
jgi:peptidyl-prolyl cis-trans isomerase SurA